MQGQLRLDFVVFNGILRTQRNEEHYNQAFSKSVPDKVKVKMLGLDIQSSHFDYRVSLNKHNDVTKVHAKVLMQCGLKEILQNASVALKELEEELQQLNEIF